jgi:hypothetical protein
LEAKKFLENPRFVAKLANMLGKPFELAHNHLLPESVQKLVGTSVNKALTTALNLAISSIKQDISESKGFNLAEKSSKKNGFIQLR